MASSSCFWRSRAVPRLLPTIRDYSARKGKAPELLSFALAGLIVFYQRKDVKDDPAALAMFENAWNSKAPAATLVEQVLRQSAVWGSDLNEIPGLTMAVTRGVEAILSKGCDVAVRDVTGGSFRLA